VSGPALKRFLLPAVLAFFIACATPACAEVKPAAVARQEIRVTLAPESHLLQGESTVSFAAAGERVFFALSPAANIDRVSAAGHDAPFSFAGGTLAVDLPRGMTGGPVPVTIVYHASFNDPVPERPVNSEEPTYGVTAAITPAGVFLAGDAGWYPDPQAAPKRRSIRIAAPAGFEAVTAGRRTERRTEQGVSHSSWVEELPVGRLSLSAGRYLVAESRAGNVEIYTYFYPDNAGLSARYLEAAARYIGFYSELFGPYPFEKFAVVENFFPTGYGFPSYTLLGSAIIRLPFIIDTSFPHEIAHCWWGNGVLVDYGQGNWSEGLVTYLADYLLEEKKSAAAGRDYRFRLLSDYASLVAPERDFPLRSFSGRIDPASRAIGYGKAAMVFHMVRSQIGDQAFFGALRELCREKLYSKAGWSDFIRAFSRSAGRDLAPVMEQWLVRPSGPRLALEDVTVTRREGAWRVSGSVVQTPPLYEVSLPLRLETASAPLRQTLAVAGERTPFSFSAAAPPRRLLLDPEADVFRLLAASELPPTVNRLKGAKELLVVITENCRAREETLRLLLESLGQQRAQLLTEDRADAAALRRHDLLFCGAPQRHEEYAAFPEGITISSREFSAFGKRYSSGDNLIIAVKQHPFAEGRVAAVFLPLSEAAAERYALKITHYGKYSCLVFAGGENRHKQIFPPAAGGSVVDFSGETGGGQ
jgi:aminopeptidase N